MRRIKALLGTAALVVPAVVSLTAAPAQAATGSLTIRTLTRAGAQLNGAVALVDLSTASERYVTSGGALSVAPGRYAVIGDVWNAEDDTDTVGGQIVTVYASKTTTATIDARKGSPIRLGLSSSPGPGYEHEIQTSVCAYLPDACFGIVGAVNDSGRVYAVPNSAPQLRIAYMSTWTSRLSNTEYAGRGYSASGIPASIVGTFDRGAMTTVAAQVRRGSNYGAGQDLAIQPQGAEPLGSLFHEAVAASGPFRAALHLSPGSWDLRSDDFAANGDDLGYFHQTLAAAPGRSYAPVLYRTTFGPARTMPYIVGGRLGFWTGAMFQDPTAQGEDACVRATSTLGLGGRTIARSDQYEYGSDHSVFSAGLPSAGWYTLNVAASRYYPPAPRPGYMLSTASTLRFHFYANPRAADTALPGFLTQFIPLGLNLHSAAPPSSRTDVTLWLSRPANGNAPTPSDTVASVRTWASYDGGRTWHAVGVTHSGGRWTAHVTNPASGAVSLRSTVTDTRGNSVDTTVYRAYAVS